MEECLVVQEEEAVVCWTSSQEEVEEVVGVEAYLQLLVEEVAAVGEAGA